MTTDPRVAKQNRLDEVRALLEAFGNKYLTQELTTYAIRLWEHLARKRNCDVTKGKKEIWASAVVCVIARLNFLFDKKNRNYLPMDKIWEYFGTKRGMVSVRATEIEKVCKISLGQEGLCSEEISDQFTFIQLPNGMVIPRALAKKEGFI